MSMHRPSLQLLPRLSSSRFTQALCLTLALASAVLAAGCGTAQSALPFVPADAPLRYSTYFSPRGELRGEAWSLALMVHATHREQVFLEAQQGLFPASEAWLSLEAVCRGAGALTTTESRAATAEGKALSAEARAVAAEAEAASATTSRLLSAESLRLSYALSIEEASALEARLLEWEAESSGTREAFSRQELVSGRLNPKRRPSELSAEDSLRWDEFEAYRLYSRTVHVSRVHLIYEARGVGLWQDLAQRIGKETGVGVHFE
jgi:hypothetical protein